MHYDIGGWFERHVISFERHGAVHRVVEMPITRNQWSCAIQLTSWSIRHDAIAALKQDRENRLTVRRLAGQYSVVFRGTGRQYGLRAHTTKPARRFMYGSQAAPGYGTEAPHISVSLAASGSIMTEYRRTSGCVSPAPISATILGEPPGRRNSARPSGVKLTNRTRSSPRRPCSASPIAAPLLKRTSQDGRRNWRASEMCPAGPRPAIPRASFHWRRHCPVSLPRSSCAGTRSCQTSSCPAVTADGSSVSALAAQVARASTYRQDPRNSGAAPDCEA